MKFKKSLFIFRRDLRLQDNTGLIEALKSSERVVPCFIFDPRQVKGNSFRSDNAVQFMVESLKDLSRDVSDKGGRLSFLYGKASEVVARLIKEEKIDAVFVNKDYTPFSINRDLSLQDVCRKQDISFFSFGDALLNEPNDVPKLDGGVYTVFTPFMKRARQRPVREPLQNRAGNYFTSSITGHNRDFLDQVLSFPNEKVYTRGGRKEAMKLLRRLKDLKQYDKERDLPAVDGTSGLSAHHKFGTVSIREVYHKAKDLLGARHTLIDELYWRDFFTHIGFHYPQVLGQAFKEKYSRIKWSQSKKDFQAWCDGQTGFPIVDAGMRELNATGFMHNRVRMIVSSFLVKDLHINWQWGEKYFARKLIDYDPLVNNGNWQWAASTGCDAQPYFRIFNPWRQQERFDPDCVYIKKWVPELNTLTPKEIHKLADADSLFAGDYPPPMVDHKTQSEQAKKMYKVLA